MAFYDLLARSRTRDCEYLQPNLHAAGDALKGRELMLDTAHNSMVARELTLVWNN